jgi:hypothetical protein
MRTNRSSRSCCDQFGEIGAILVPARGTPAFRPLIPGATSSSPSRLDGPGGGRRKIRFNEQRAAIASIESVPNPAPLLPPGIGPERSARCEARLRSTLMKVGSQWTPPWSKADSNRWSHSEPRLRRTVQAGINATTTGCSSHVQPPARGHEYPSRAASRVGDATSDKFLHRASTTNRSSERCTHKGFQ